MLDLKQRELAAWQDRNFPKRRYEQLSRGTLIDLIIKLQLALGMAEEVGEICHHVLKGSQGIRGGVNGFNVDGIADRVDDTKIYGNQLLSEFKVNAEASYEVTVNRVLSRDWIKNLTGMGMGGPIQTRGSDE